MEDAKVLINLKEGIIEIEGPADFVKHCLDMYGPGIRGLLGLPQDTAAAPEKASRVSQKRTAAVVAKPRSRRRATVMATMRDDLEAGFFDKPRSTAEIKQRVNDAGLTFTDTGVRANLRKLTQDGLLDAVKRGRSVRLSDAPDTERTACAGLVALGCMNPSPSSAFGELPMRFARDSDTDFPPAVS